MASDSNVDRNIDVSSNGSTYVYCVPSDEKNPAYKVPTNRFGDVGHDLYAAENIVIPAHGFGVVGTNVTIGFPKPKQSDTYIMYGRVAPRSSLAIRGINIGAGVIDPSYQGEIKVVLFNHNNVDFKVSVGDKIAQLIFELTCHVTLADFDAEAIGDDSRRLTITQPTERGAGGFGSTDKK